MELLRQWAMRVCVSCVLAGALGYALPAKGSARVIKTVLALYILVSVLAPVQHTDWTDVFRRLTEPPRLTASTIPADADALVGRTALDSLAEHLTLQLAQEGIEAEVEVKAADTQGPQASLEITALLRDMTRSGEAEAILRGEMNGAGSILCRGMEGSS